MLLLHTGCDTRAEEPLISNDNHKNKVDGALRSHPPLTPHGAPQIMGCAAPTARVTWRSKPCIGSGNVEAEAQAGGWHLHFHYSKISIQRWEPGLEGWVRGIAGHPELLDPAQKLTRKRPWGQRHKHQLNVRPDPSWFPQSATAAEGRPE